MSEESLLAEVLKDTESQMRENNLEGFKAEIKTLVRNAQHILGDVKPEIGNHCVYPELLKKLCLLECCLNNLRRACGMES
ncbi:MAG: hypothetical protein WCY34_06855 [Candidatus Omnitrophota bacterium]|jgi:hypothetical protein